MNKNRSTLDHVGYLSHRPRSRRRFAVLFVALFTLFTWQTIPRWFFDQLDKRRCGGSQLPATKRVTVAPEG